MLTPFEAGLVAHFVADWLLQNDWMAMNKGNLRHPAGWVHGGIHAVLLGLALGWQAGVILGAVHILIDTRQPLIWWRRVFRQTETGDVSVHVRMWSDQVLHIMCIALWVTLTGLSF